MRLLSKAKDNLSYYERPEISNSDIGYYSQYGARAFQKYKNRQRGNDSTDSMDLGTKIHSYVLENDRFKELYGCCIDSPGGMMSKFIEYIANNPVDESEMDRIYTEARMYSGFSWSIKAILKQLEDPKNQAYMLYLRQNEGKSSISYDDMQICKGTYEAIKGNEKAAYYLNIDGRGEDSNIRTFTELEVYWPCRLNQRLTDGIGIKEQIMCKSKLDKVIVNLDDHLITVVDLKTTSKPIGSFIDNYRDYRIYRQLSFYRDAVKHYMELYWDGFNEDDWEFDTKIVATMTKEPYSVKVFNPLNIDIEMGKEEYIDILSRMQYHLATGEWQDDAKVENISVFSPLLENE